MKTVREIIKGHELHVVQEDQMILEVIHVMAQSHIGAVPVLAGDRLVGIFSERDLMIRVVAQGLDPRSTRVAEVMTREILVVDAEESYDQCLRKMKQINARHLPVVSKDSLVGMISLRDLLLFGIDAKDEEIRMLTAYIHYVPPGWKGEEPGGTPR
ncbi:MAG: CBS domain-containing protein [Candidatus Methylomirabilales bacterium]